MVPHECHRIGAKSGNASLFCNNFTTNQITTPPSGRFTIAGENFKKKKSSNSATLPTPKY